MVWIFHENSCRNVDARRWFGRRAHPLRKRKLISPWARSTKISIIHAPRTPILRPKDLNHNNTLDIGEDIGIPFHNPDATITTLGAIICASIPMIWTAMGLSISKTPTVGGNIGYDASSGLIVAPRIADITFDSNVGANRMDYSG